HDEKRPFSWKDLLHAFVGTDASDMSIMIGQHPILRISGNMRAYRGFPIVESKDLDVFLSDWVSDTDKQTLNAFGATGGLSFVIHIADEPIWTGVWRKRGVLGLAFCRSNSPNFPNRVSESAE